MFIAGQAGQADNGPGLCLRGGWVWCERSRSGGSLGVRFGSGGSASKTLGETSLNVRLCHSPRISYKRDSLSCSLH